MHPGVRLSTSSGSTHLSATARCQPSGCRSQPDWLQSTAPRNCRCDRQPRSDLVLARPWTTHGGCRQLLDPRADSSPWFALRHSPRGAMICRPISSSGSGVAASGSFRQRQPASSSESATGLPRHSGHPSRNRAIPCSWSLRRSRRSRRSRRTQSRAGTPLWPSTEPR